MCSYWIQAYQRGDQKPVANKAGEPLCVICLIVKGGKKLPRACEAEFKHKISIKRPSLSVSPGLKKVKN